ncbi:hypothetical protein EF919_18265 [Streptomyces sp. WAC02707]|uniref:hypothetical protein n=1 Tax=Streptomyces sp. WAC02707 TaxID=2487417 RepID=UPI000F7A31F9|nr:hypothetical protein [Streptomyces sp. WAC02707]RSS92479.1 hypothetical protein EF919_18265 [Streptomyces sp. WAC02707]
MTIRHTVDSITSDALDQLYADLDRYEEVVGELNEANTGLARQAARAEAVIARARTLHQEWDADPGHCAHCQDGMGTPLPWPCPTIRALDGEQPAPAPAATHVKTLPPMPISDGIAEMYGGWPREHCGDPMPAWVAGPRSECTLRPGHTGSHADDRGARWWYDPTGGNHTPPSRVVHTTSTTPPTENP